MTYSVMFKEKRKAIAAMFMSRASKQTIIHVFKEPALVKGCEIER